MSSVRRSINENAPAATAAGDPNGDTLSYETSSENLSIDPRTGAITATQILDHEQKAVHTLTVTATDQHGAAAIITVNVRVNNLEEHGAVTLDNIGPRTGDTVSAILTAPDTSAQSCQWQRSGADIAGADSSSYPATPDDLGHTFRVTVGYTDPQGAGKSTESEPTTAVSNDPPAFTENAPAGTPVRDPLSATDPNGDELSYSLSGDDAGQVTMTAVPDYEARNAYTLTATVQDPAGGMDSLTVNVTVSNVEEPGTVTFDSQSQPEVGTALTASLRDPDGAVTGQAWQWQAGESAAGPWTGIDGADSASYTPGAGDVQSHLRAAVTYADGHGSQQDSASAVTPLPVRPEPNRPPAFGEMDTTINLSINHPTGERIGTQVPATDPNGDPLTFTLSVTPDAGTFTIEADTGHIRMGEESHQEDDVFTLAVSISDGFGEDGYADPATDAHLTITITMVDPNIETDATNTRHIPRGLWGNDDHLSTVYRASPAYTEAYDRQTGARVEGKSFTVHPTSRQVEGATSHGDTVWVLIANRSTPGKIRAFSTEGQRRSGKDITLHRKNDAENGIWTDGTTMYVGDSRDQKLYAYNVETGNRDSGKEINLPDLPGYLVDIWSDGETVWTASWLQAQMQAYRLSNGERRPELDLTLSPQNIGPVGMWSDGQIMYVINQVYDTIFGYTLPR